MTPPAGSSAAPNRNTLWARAIVEELARSGVREVCVAPGSRSTPLVLAIGEATELRAHVFVDERSAAFFALGIGRASGAPAAVVTTSGTAVANLLPAAVEAHQAEVPLLLVTADRPHHLRDADANQAIRQTGIFRDFARATWDLPQPIVDDQALRHLRAVVCRCVAAAVGAPAGPVHLNVPFRKPLEPILVEGDVPADFGERFPVAAFGRGAEPVVRIGRRTPRLTQGEIDVLAEAVSTAARPILVAGPSSAPAQVGEAIAGFAAASGVPVLADPLSGARTRSPDSGSWPTSYDLFLRSPAVREALTPDLVVRVGTAPTSAALTGWLESMLAIRQVVIDGGVRWKDHVNAAAEVLRGDPADALGRLADRVSAGPATRDGSWVRRWAEVDGAARAGAGGGAAHEGRLAQLVVQGTPSKSAVFVSSSMPIRDVDGFGGRRSDGLPIHANRGASGIDGIVSSAAGCSLGAGRPVVALVGDLALLHDGNGLLALRNEGVEVTFVVVNNDGGGIFHMLPVRHHDPHFTRFFATPHGLDLAHLARLYDLPHLRLEGIADAEGRLPAILAEGGSRIVEITTDREENRRGHEEAVAGAVAAAERALKRDVERDRE